MTRPVHYDNTILIRLSSEMKEAFYAVCKARGVAPSEHARNLMTDYVLNHWGVFKSSLWGVDTTLDMFPADDQPPSDTSRSQKKKRRYNGQVKYYLGYVSNKKTPKKNHKK